MEAERPLPAQTADGDHGEDPVVIRLAFVNVG